MTYKKNGKRDKRVEWLPPIAHKNQYLSKFLRIEFSFRMRGFDNNFGKNRVFKTFYLKSPSK